MCDLCDIPKDRWNVRLGRASHSVPFHLPWHFSCSSRANPGCATVMRVSKLVIRIYLSIFRYWISYVKTIITLNDFCVHCGWMWLRIWSGSNQQSTNPRVRCSIYEMPLDKKPKLLMFGQVLRGSCHHCVSVCEWVNDAKTVKCFVSKSLFALGFKTHLWRSDHKWTAPNTSVNNFQDALWSSHSNHLSRWFGMHFNTSPL